MVSMTNPTSYCFSRQRSLHALHQKFERKPIPRALARGGQSGPVTLDSRAIMPLFTDGAPAETPRLLSRSREEDAATGLEI